MIPSALSPANSSPTPTWASLPLFDRTGWKCVRFGRRGGELR